MPVTFLFVFLGALGALLFVPALPLAVFLLAVKKRKVEALVVLGIPSGVILLSVLLTLGVFVAAEFQSRLISARPNLLFRQTFGFQPPAQTRVLEAYHKGGMDYATTVMEFTATMDTIDRITAHNFAAIDRTTFLSSYQGNAHNLPRRVQSWFLSLQEDPKRFYMARQFGGAFGHSEAILCYDEQTGLAHFHWVGLD